MLTVPAELVPDFFLLLVLRTDFLSSLAEAADVCVCVCVCATKLCPHAFH